MEECNPQKVQGHKLQHLGYNIAQYEAIWLTLIFWSKCPTSGHPDLGQPVNGHDDVDQYDLYKIGQSK